MLFIFEVNMAIKYNCGDIVGDYGIVYISESDKRGGKNRRALFRCSCGEEFDCIIDSIKRGSTKSCGCSTSKMKSESNTKHGKGSSKSGRRNRVYTMRDGMISRCYNKNNPRYADWGGRGVKLCDEWLNSFEAFYEWAASNGYEDNLQIDRINNLGDYCPENCRFVTPQENSRNKRPYKSSKTGISGVTWDKKCGKYIARISISKTKRVSLGMFSDFFEACCARKSSENRYW